MERTTATARGPQMSEPKGPWAQEGPRPIYQKQKDVDRENEALLRFCDSKGWIFERLPFSYKLDAVALLPGIEKMKDRTILAWIEVKARPTSTTADFQGMRGLYLSWAKWQCGVEMSRLSDVPFYILVPLADGELFVYRHYPDHKLVPFWGGRHDKTARDTADREPEVVVPIGFFSRLAK